MASRRRLLAGLGALGGLVIPSWVAADPAAALGDEPAQETDPTPPPEAYQPAATKNWWYFNGHLYDADDPAEPLYNYMGAYVMEHGGDTMGHLQLFTFVENRADDEDGLRFAESVQGLVQPSTEDYAARYTGPDATGHALRTDDGRPERWHVYMDPQAPVVIDLHYASTYEPRLHEAYQEGGGVGNVIFWNQAIIEGRVRTPDGVRPVVGVGFLEHVWGAWSRVPQKGVDYVNAHLEAETGPPDDRHRQRPREADPRAGDSVGRTHRRRNGGGNLPTWGSVYFRRSFYHGIPRDQGAEDGEPILDDVGPDLYVTGDGETWYEAVEIDVFLTEPDGERVELSEHRRGRPTAIDIEAALEKDGALSLHLDALPDVTIANPHEAESLGDVHEGGAVVEGTVRLPGAEQAREVSGVAQTEHQRYGPQYPY